MKKNILILLMAFSGLLTSPVFAQDEVTRADAAGTALRTQPYVNVIGSPYINDNWVDGLVKLSDGKIYKNKIKYDQVSDKIIFLGDKEETMEYVNVVLEFRLPGAVLNQTGDLIFVNGFEPVDGSSEKSFFEVINYTDQGKLKFLKRITKKIYESRVYNSATTDRTIEAKTTYYLSKDRKPVKIKLDKKSILNAIGEKSTELGTYIDGNHLNLKNEEDVDKLIKFYNSL